MSQRFLFVAVIVILYGWCLFLPVMVYQASEHNNPKHRFCVLATNKYAHCFRYGPEINNYRCGFPQDPIMSQKDIHQYCGDDWNVPYTKIDHGYRALIWGWTLAFSGNFAWFGNPLLIMALVSLLSKKVKRAFTQSVYALATGLTAFAWKWVPLDEALVNFDRVDHLGIGYYLWLACIAVTLIYSYKEWSKNDPFIAMSPRRAVLFICTVSFLFFVPSYTLNQFMGKNYLQDQADNKAALERKYSNLVNRFFDVLTKKNYKVTAEENDTTIYFQKAILTKVGTARSDPEQHYMIYKNQKVYSVNPIKKIFTEVPGLDKDFKPTTALKKMQADSGLGFLMEISFASQPESWEHNGNTQTLRLSEYDVEATFEPQTYLVTTLKIAAKGNTPSTTRVWHFHYEEISDEEMAQALVFPQDYKKVEVLPAVQ